MKLNDCGCGGTPQITFNIEGNDLFNISCPSCGNATPGNVYLDSAELFWNTWSSKQGYGIPEDATA
jgi:hypothetical protein